jgi:hypothetical protein
MRFDKRLCGWTVSTAPARHDDDHEPTVAGRVGQEPDDAATLAAASDGSFFPRHDGGLRRDDGRAGCVHDQPDDAAASDGRADCVQDHPDDAAASGSDQSSLLHENDAAAAGSEDSLSVGLSGRQLPASQPADPTINPGSQSVREPVSQFIQPRIQSQHASQLSSPQDDDILWKVEHFLPGAGVWVFRQQQRLQESICKGKVAPPASGQAASQTTSKTASPPATW